MSFAMFMGMSALMSSDSVNSLLEKQIKPVISVAEEVHQYTPLGILTDWISVNTTEADIWEPPDEVLDAIGQEMVKRLGLAMEWRLNPEVALLPWHGQAAWDALYEETMGEAPDIRGRHQFRHDGHLPFSEAPATRDRYKEFFALNDNDMEVSDATEESAESEGSVE